MNIVIIIILLLISFKAIDKIAKICKANKSMLNIEIYRKIILTNIYYDYRYNSLRLIVINYKRYFPNVTCILKYRRNTQKCMYSYKCYYLFNKRPHGHLLISLFKNLYPEKLYINNIFIPVPQRTIAEHKFNLTVCICTTVNYVAVRSVIQTLETYKYYGVDHFVVYKTTVSKDVDRALKYYENNNIMDVIVWNKTLEYQLKLKNVYYGQIYKYNDCLYRYMYKTKSLIITDWDEIIIPVKEKSISKMINNNYDKKINWFKFRSFLFRKNFYKGNNNDMNIEDTDIYIYRNYCIFKRGCVVKNLYRNLQSIVVLEIHGIGDSAKEINSTEVKIIDGFIRHTRRVNKKVISYCNSTWMIYPKDNREEIILQKFNEVKNKLELFSSTKKCYKNYKIFSTGASSNHFRLVILMLYRLFKIENNICIAVWDLGLTNNEKCILLKAEKYIINRKKNILIYNYYFNYSLYPKHFNIIKMAGYYAWKPFVIYETYKIFKKNLLWLDAGCFVKNELKYEYNEIKIKKIWSIVQYKSIISYTHKKTLYLLDTNKYIYNQTMCAGGVIGLYYPSFLVERIMNLWKACALIKKCISPDGSNKRNHRYDQSIISILMHQNNISCDSTSEINFDTHFDSKYRYYNDSDYNIFLKTII